MNPERREFLSLAILPARLSITETSWFLGFAEEDIPLFISVGLLKPLGHPPASGSKYFALAELEKLRSDTRWLAKASDAKVNHWKQKNAGRGSHQPASAPNGAV